LHALILPQPFDPHQQKTGVIFKLLPCLTSLQFLARAGDASGSWVKRDPFWASMNSRNPKPTFEYQRSGQNDRLDRGGPVNAGTSLNALRERF